MKTTSRLLLKPSQLSPLPNSFLRYSTHPTPSTSTSTPTPTPTPLPSTSTTPPTKSFSPTKTNLPGSNLPGAAKYSPITVSIVTSLAKLFGYHSQTSTAIRTASDYYDRCSERGQVEAQFFYDGSYLSLSLSPTCPSFFSSSLFLTSFFSFPSSYSPYNRMRITTFIPNLVLNNNSAHLALIRSISVPPFTPR